ncbi:MAG TPA: DUF1003 domain-containing protein [Caulobacteraceae bacterium]|nr:DUF1003 domain-containing protein [Caulobacteraceae bacterium]
MTDAVDRSLMAERELSGRLLGKPYEELTPIQKSVVDLVAAEAPSKEHPQISPLDERTFWQRLADNVAAVGGSWGFIGAFGVVLFGWILTNLALGVKGAFDPYPFIFLNLMLSMLAAIQAPVIMMSQNRAAAKDREAAEHDYVVNLRAELELMHLHDKLDAVRERELESLIRGQTETIELLKRQIAGLAKDLEEHEASAQGG